MDLIEVMRTTNAARVFTDEPVSDELLIDILDDARFAPSGGNRQPWRVAVVRDLAVRRRIAELMRGVWEEYLGAAATGVTPFAFGRSIDARPVSAPNAVIDDIVHVPVVLAVAANLHDVASMDGLLDRPAMVGGASIYPFCWNVVLAARARGLGGVITTFLSREEPAATPVLGLPADHALAATIFLGHVEGFPRKLNRRPVSSFATVDRFDGETFGG
ncbi:MAG: nitroreductase family protein [Ilumatobacteraceae bacterium]